MTDHLQHSAIASSGFKDTCSKNSEANKRFVVLLMVVTALLIACFCAKSCDLEGAERIYVDSFVLKAPPSPLDCGQQSRERAPVLFRGPPWPVASMRIVPRSAEIDVLWLSLAQDEVFEASITYTFVDPMAATSIQTLIRRGKLKVIGNFYERDADNIQREKKDRSFYVELDPGGESMLGVHKFSLRSNGGDCTHAREVLVSELYAEMCIASYRLKPVQVFIRSELAGVFMLAEWINKAFIERTFGMPGPGAALYDMKWGFLYEDLGLEPEPYRMACHRFKKVCPSFWKLQKRGPAKGLCCGNGQRYDAISFDESHAFDIHVPIVALVQAIHNGSDDDLRNIMDMSTLLRNMVVDIAVGQWDGFWRNYNNYFLYNSDASKPFFRLIPFDTDHAFRIKEPWKNGALVTGFTDSWDTFCCLPWGAYVGTPNHLIHRALSGTFRAEFLLELAKFLTTQFAPVPDSPIAQRAGMWNRMLAAALAKKAASKAPCPPQAWQSGFNEIYQFAHDRSCFLLEHVGKSLVNGTPMQNDVKKWLAKCSKAELMTT